MAELALIVCLPPGLFRQVVPLSCLLTHTSFQTHLEKLLCLDRELHR